MNWIRAHGWKLLLPALALGAVGGYWVRPQPAVELHQTKDTASAAAVDVQQHVDAGPVDVKRRWTLYGAQASPRLPVIPPVPGNAAPGTAVASAGIPCQVSAVLEEEEHRGPVATDTHATGTAQSTTAEHTDYKVTPVSAQRLALGAGWIFTQQAPYLTGGIRVFGQVWIDAVVLPEPIVRGRIPDVGVGLRFHF